MRLVCCFNIPNLEPNPNQSLNQCHHRILWPRTLFSRRNSWYCDNRIKIPPWNPLEKNSNSEIRPKAFILICLNTNIQVIYCPQFELKEWESEQGSSLRLFSGCTQRIRWGTKVIGNLAGNSAGRSVTKYLLMPLSRIKYSIFYFWFSYCFTAGLTNLMRQTSQAILTQLAQSPYRAGAMDQERPRSTPSRNGPLRLVLDMRIYTELMWLYTRNLASKS